MERTILVKSSSREEPYSVKVSSTVEHGLTIMCDCAAGEWGKYCKHKMAVALGDATILFDDEQIDSFKEISNWIVSSNYPNLFSEIPVLEKKSQEYERTNSTIYEGWTQIEQSYENTQKKKTRTKS